MSSSALYKRSEVFVVGVQPTVTYAARESEHFEARIADYLEERGRILVVTGPSKSGKTVLLRRTIPDGLRISGGSIESLDVLWSEIVAQSGGFPSEKEAATQASSEGSRLSGTAALKPKGIGAGLVSDESSLESDTRTRERARTRPDRDVALESLVMTERPLIIDDFHHISPDLQHVVVRSLKRLIEDGVAVVFAAVPHHAADIVRAEREMEGRVESLKVGLWDKHQLREIAQKGFDFALNVECPEPLTERVTEFAARSPHLMQLLCRELCKLNAINETLDARRALIEPDDWPAFLGKIAENYTDDTVYARLARGPQARRPRRTLQLTDGSITDIYGALLAGIASTGPLDSLTYDDIRRAWARIVATSDEPAKRPAAYSLKDRVTFSLKQMTKIAIDSATNEHGQLMTDPVLEFDPDEETLYIADPFFAFRLRWGPRIPMASDRQ